MFTEHLLCARHVLSALHELLYLILTKPKGVVIYYSPLEF